MKSLNLPEHDLSKKEVFKQLRSVASGLIMNHFRDKTITMEDGKKFMFLESEQEIFLEKQSKTVRTFDFYHCMFLQNVDNLHERRTFVTRFSVDVSTEQKKFAGLLDYHINVYSIPYMRKVHYTGICFSGLYLGKLSFHTRDQSAYDMIRNKLLDRMNEQYKMVNKMGKYSTTV